MILGVLFICQGQVASSQTLHVFYKKQVVPNENDIPRWYSSAAEKRRYMMRKNEEANNVRSYYNLYTDGMNAVFKFDTLVDMRKEENRERGWWGGNYEKTYYWRSNLRKGISIKHSSLLPDSICTGINTQETYEWQMDKGVKVFCDILCNKAFTLNENGDTIVAWFTRAIPISAGPETYSGLPGLILAVESPTAIYIAEWIKKIEKEIEPAPSDLSTCISEDKFREKAWQANVVKRLNNNDD